MQFVSGWIVDRFDVNRVIAAGFLLWSLATAATGLVRGFTMLLAMRLMLGIVESVMSPAYSKILSFHLPEHHRGFANGVLQAAVRSGPAVGTLGTGLLIAKYGWRPAFIGIGIPIGAHAASLHKSLDCGASFGNLWQARVRAFEVRKKFLVLINGLITLSAVFVQLAEVIVRKDFRCRKTSH